MIKNIITYPNQTGVEYAPDVRVFDEELYTFIDDLKETAEANKLDGLSAPQVGSYYNVAVVKKDGEFLELINPRVLNKKGEIISAESSSYFPNASAEISRYEEITLVYDDRESNQHSLKADGEFGILLQRKIDYLYGATFLTKLKGEQRDNFEASLNSNGLSCPNKPKGFSRDFFIKFSNVIMIVMVLLIIASLFIDDEKTTLGMWESQLYLSFFVGFLNIVYVLYSLYENKKFSVCTNCYNMSIFGVTVITLVRLSGVMLVSYFLIL